MKNPWRPTGGSLLAIPRRPRSVAAVATLGLVGITLGVIITRAGQDPWPPRLVLAGALQGKGTPWGYSPDGRSFRTTGAAGLTSWDATTGERGTTTPPPVIQRKAVSSDGRRFVGWVGGLFGAAEVVAGDAATETIEQRFPVQGMMGADFAFRDGDRAIEVVLGDIQGKRTVATWDLATGAESRRAVPGPGATSSTRPLAYSPDGRVWAYFDTVRDALQLWDPAADRAIGGPLRTPTTRWVRWLWPSTGVLFTPDGRTLIIGRSDGQAEFWDVGDGHLIKLVRLHPAGYTAMELKLAPDRRTLASCGADLTYPSRLARTWGQVRKYFTGQDDWDPKYETVVLDLATDQVLARARRSSIAEFSPDSRTIVTQERPAGTISFRAIPQARSRGPVP